MDPPFQHHHHHRVTTSAPPPFSVLLITLVRNTRRRVARHHHCTTQHIAFTPSRLKFKILTYLLHSCHNYPKSPIYLFDFPARTKTPLWTGLASIALRSSRPCQSPRYPFDPRIPSLCQQVPRPLFRPKIANSPRLYLATARRIYRFLKSDVSLRW